MHSRPISAVSGQGVSAGGSAVSGQGVSAGGQTTRSWGGGSNSSYYEDRQSVFSLTGTGAAAATGQQRPLGGLLNTLVDAAHQAHDNRKLLHPSTYAYSIFNWKVQEGAQRTGKATASEASLVRSYASSATAATAAAALQASIPGTHNAPQRARLGSSPAEEFTMSALRLRTASVGGSSYTGSRISSAHTIQAEFVGPAPDLEVRAMRWCPGRVRSVFVVNPTCRW